MAMPPYSTLEFASAIEAASAIRRRQVSSEELTRLMLDRISQFNPALTAIVNVVTESAMAEARAADDALANGDTTRPLLGVPVTIKDCFQIAGVPTTGGAPFLKDHRPVTDAPGVRRLREAGAVILGNTNVPFMLSDWQSFNDIYGTSNNPWDRSRTPGGSSGGSAAALAAGLGYLSLGSDLAGSIRIPAHFCGVYGHKPTLNVVSRLGNVPPPPGSPPTPPPDLAVAGPMARSAADLKLAMEILGGPDEDEAVAYSWRLLPARAPRLADYRIGFVIDDSLCPVSEDVRTVLAEAIDALRRAGVRLVEGWPPGVDAASQYETYRYLLSAYLAVNFRDDKIDEVRARAANPDGGMDAVAARAWIDPHKYFLQASAQRMAARSVWQHFFKEHDAFLLPTSFVPAFPHDQSRPVNGRSIATPEGPREYMDLTFWIGFASLAGLPATTAPAGLTRENLPVGIQIMGPYLEDATPIDVAAKMAGAFGGFRPPAWAG
jgi:amidase